MNEFQISDNKVDRKSCPHHATITMKIDIRKMYDDGSLDNQVMGNRLLADYGITSPQQLYDQETNLRAGLWLYIRADDAYGDGWQPWNLTR